MHMEGFASQYQFTAKPEDANRHGRVHNLIIILCSYINMILQSYLLVPTLTSGVDAILFMREMILPIDSLQVP